MLGTPEQAAEAIVEAASDDAPSAMSRASTRGWAALRSVAPGLVRRALASKRAGVLATKTRDRG